MKQDLYQVLIFLNIDVVNITFYKTGFVPSSDLLNIDIVIIMGYNTEFVYIPKIFNIEVAILIYFRRVSSRINCLLTNV